MKAVFKARPAPGLTVGSAPVPVPGPNEVLLKVLATTICGTDVHIYKWDPWSQAHIKPPLIIGHEMSGEVVELGAGVKSAKPGDYVSVETHFVDWTCPICKLGAPHLCWNLKTLGIDVNGCYAEYVVVPAVNVWKNSKKIPPEIASLQEPMGNAVYSVLAEPVAGKTVSVFGAGPIGLMSAAVARAEGATKVFVVEPHPFRLALAPKMGATISINPALEDPVKRILEETNGIGADVFLEMSGAQKAYEQGFASLRNGGRASLLGLPGGATTLNMSDAVIMKGATVYGIHGRLMFKTWEQVSDLLNSGKVDLSPILTRTMKLDEVESAMELLARQEASKIALIP